MMIGILTPVFLNIPTNQWIQQMREWEAERNRPSVEDVLNSSLEDFNNGSNDPTEQEELLQLSSNQD